MRTNPPEPLYPSAQNALTVLGDRIRIARHAKGWTAAKLAQAANVSRPTVLAVEAGRPTVAVGTVFTLAHLAGVRLFGADELELARLRREGRDTLALLPSRVDPGPIGIDDDF